MTDEAPKCGAFKPYLPWVTCGLDQRLSKPDENGDQHYVEHNGLHAAFATNPGQWTGNKQPIGPTTRWGTAQERERE